MTEFEKSLQELENFSVIKNENDELLFEESYSSFTTIFSNLLEELTNLILSGEYCKEIEKTKQSITDIAESANRIKTDLSNIAELDNNINDSFYITFESINNLVFRFKSLLSDLDLKFQNKLHKKLFISDDSSLSSSNYIELVESIKFINENLISLEYYDHFLVVENNVLVGLVNILSQNKSSFYSNKFSELIDLKCKILIKKILYRLKEDKDFSFRYVHNFEDKDLADIFEEKLSNFLEIEEKLLCHYGDDVKVDSLYLVKLKENCKPILEKYPTNEINFYEYQLLSKYFKDFLKDDSKITELINSFDNLRIKQVLSFDKYSYAVTKIYLRNNLLSLKIFKANKKYSESSFNDIKDCYNSIILVQKEADIDNYFSHLYFAEYLTSIIEGLFQENKKLEVIESLLNELKEIIKNAFLSHEWCNKRDYVSYRVPFKECLFNDVNEPSKNIFLATSYILPNNYEPIIIQLNNVQFDLDKYQFKLEVEKRILQSKTEFTEIENKFRSESIELKDTVKESEKKNIEILSIFAAIVLFVAGEIRMFQFITDAHLAVYFTIAFAFSLSTFTLLIWLITRRDYKKEAFSWSRAGIVVVFLIGTICSLNYLSKNKFPTQPKIEQYDKAIQKIDSLEEVLIDQKERIDTLSKK